MLKWNRVLMEEASNGEQSAGTGDGGGLPSFQETANEIEASLKLSDTYVKDGKILGRFDNADALVDAYHEMEKTYANKMREIKESEKAEEQTEQQRQEQAERIAAQSKVVNELVAEFMQSGMELTPEIEKKAVEAEIDIRDVKLGALELKERVANAHAVVGGSEEYANMISWANEALNDKQKAAFDKDVVGDMSEFAIRGLHSMYRNAIESGKAPTRVSGSSAGSSQVGGYASIAELMKDRRYIEGSGRNDAKAVELYKRRLSMTPDDVIFGKRA